MSGCLGAIIEAVAQVWGERAMQIGRRTVKDNPIGQLVIGFIVFTLPFIVCCTITYLVWVASFG
jgi:tetrahydromethanopterin S-methyltransferase subunit G